MLSDEQIDAVTLAQWGEMKGYPLAAHRAYARAIEAEVRKQDDALIQKLVEALEECKDSTQERIDQMEGTGLDKHKPVAFAAYVQDLLRANQALAAGRARLEGKP